MSYRAADLVRDAIATNEAHATYSEAQGRLVELAHDLDRTAVALQAEGRPLNARIVRQKAADCRGWAWVARAAARAELIDPQPPGLA